jgi:aryl-alcohol dehydrogenase-like predicted oxidoreductase
MANNKNQRAKAISRRDFLQKGGAGALAIPFISVSTLKPAIAPGSESLSNVELEWRNKQPGMVYRQLGRTGFMVSEIVNGGMAVGRNPAPTEASIEMGLNYLDCAPAYVKGESEKALGKIFERPSMREKVFLTTKVSEFPQFRNSKYWAIFNNLSQTKKDAIMKKAEEMRQERGVLQPEYWVTYFNGQEKQLNGLYVSNAMMAEYGEEVEGTLEKEIIESVEASLQRLNTDYIDIIMCPHAASSSEEIVNPSTISAFEKLKKQGKVRHLGLSSHNDMAGVLRAALDTGYYDVAMIAYNIINHGFLDALIREAYYKGVGIIAMKAANPVTTNDPVNDPQPRWRLEKLDHFVPGDMKPPLKAYLWALQNPYLSAVISNMFSVEHVKENLALVGQKIETLPA